MTHSSSAAPLYLGGVLNPCSPSPGLKHSGSVRRVVVVARRLIALLSALCILSGGAKVQALEPASPINLLKIHTVTAASGQQWLSTNGVVEATRQSVLAAQIAGRIVERRVEPGDRVQAGQVLLRIDDREAAQTESAAQAQVSAAQAQLNNAQQELERTKALVVRQLLAQSALDRAEAAQRSALAQVRALTASAAVSSTQRSFKMVTAPYAGVVANVAVQVGDMAYTGKPLLTLYEPKNLRVISTIALSQSARRPAGSAIQLVLAGKTLSLHEYTVLPIADANSQMQQIRIPLPAGTDLLPGQLVKLAFAQTGSGAISIPAGAVFQRGEMHAVYVFTDAGRLQLRQVRLGQRRGLVPDELVEVVAGLNAGERIALEPQQAAQVRTKMPAPVNKVQP